MIAGCRTTLGALLLATALGGLPASAVLAPLGAQSGEAPAEALIETPAVPAPRDSATIVAAPEYAANRFKRFFFGRDYRDLWVTPIRVPVLDLDRFAGGLEPEKRGGGLQTTSLRFRGADGREYTFRSVAKRHYTTRDPQQQGSLRSRILQDQMSALLPAAALMAAPLLRAAGVLHADPYLAVMPDDPRLGEFRKQFAGMLGMIEERPNEGEDDEPGFAGSRKIVSTERLLERLKENDDERIDARAYLAARLMDIFLGDWDRHHDQWRWASFDHGDERVWYAVPRDRDYAFVNYDGMFPSIGRRWIPSAVAFDSEYRSLAGLTANAAPLDRRLLADLPRPAWDSVAVALQARLTDDVIHDAVRHMPREYHALVGPRLAQTLETRRNRLPQVAGRFYEQVMRSAAVQATEQP